MDRPLIGSVESLYGAVLDSPQEFGQPNLFRPGVFHGPSCESCTCAFLFSLDPPLSHDQPIDSHPGQSQARRHDSSLSTPDSKKALARDDLCLLLFDLRHAGEVAVRAEAEESAATYHESTWSVSRVM